MTDNERRSDYPSIFQELQEIRNTLENHINETRAVHELWTHTRWLLNTLKFLAALVAALVAGWFALKQLLGGH